MPMGIEKLRFDPDDVAHSLSKILDRPLDLGCVRRVIDPLQLDICSSRNTNHFPNVFQRGRNWFLNEESTRTASFDHRTTDFDHRTTDFVVSRRRRAHDEHIRIGPLEQFIERTGRRDPLLEPLPCLRTDVEAGDRPAQVRLRPL